MRFDVWTSTACAALFAACAFFLPAPSRAAEFSNDQKAEIGKIVKEYLLANPDVVKDAIEELDKREKVAEASARETTLTKQADKLFNSPNQRWSAIPTATSRWSSFSTTTAAIASSR